jgi:hypothetical protein
MYPVFLLRRKIAILFFEKSAHHYISLPFPLLFLFPPYHSLFHRHNAILSLLQAQCQNSLPNAPWHVPYVPLYLYLLRRHHHPLPHSSRHNRSQYPLAPNTTIQSHHLPLQPHELVSSRLRHLSQNFKTKTIFAGRVWSVDG